MSKAGIFTLYGAEQDRDSIRKVRKALQANYGRVCDTLEYNYRFPVRVEIYPDQRSLDQNLMDVDLAGHYACSGNRTIQMVSPAVPLPLPELPIEDQRPLIAVHEFVHLMHDEIYPDMPIWLDEGVASYLGTPEIYAYVCGHLFPFELIPSFADLCTRYYEIDAPDLFSYSAVDFLVRDFGLETVNALLRAPNSFEAITGCTFAEFETQWLAFMQQTYSSRST